MNNGQVFTAVRVRKLRKDMCLDRTNFAIAIGVSRTSVWRWEVFGDAPSQLACDAMLREELKLKAQSEAARS